MIYDWLKNYVHRIAGGVFSCGFWMGKAIQDLAPPRFEGRASWGRPTVSAVQAAAYTRGWAADTVNTRVRLKAELDCANQELLLLREEIRIHVGHRRYTDIAQP